MSKLTKVSKPSIFFNWLSYNSNSTNWVKWEIFSIFLITFLLNNNLFNFVHFSKFSSARIRSPIYCISSSSGFTGWVSSPNWKVWIVGSSCFGWGCWGFCCCVFWVLFERLRFCDVFDCWVVSWVFFCSVLFWSWGLDSINI